MSNCPAGYKQTLSGVIPEDWDSKPLAEFGYWKGGATPSMQNLKYWSSGTVPWVSSGDVKSVLISDTPMKITESAVKETSATLLPSNSIMIVTRSGILRKYLPIAKNTRTLAINQDIKALMPNSIALPDYLLHILIGNGPRILATCLKSGTTVESIEFPWLKAFHVPVPPTKAEQEAIADALSDTDAFIESLEQLIVKKRHIKQGAMQELLLGKKRLPGFSGEWKVEPLGNHVEISSGESPSRFSLKDDGIPYFKVEQLNNNDKYLVDTPYYFQAGQTIPRGSIIFPKRGASIMLNKVRILADDSFMDTNLMTLTPTASLNSEYLYYALTHIELWRIADTTSIPQINNKHILPLMFPLPHLPEQMAIAKVLSDMDIEISTLDTKLAKTRSLKQGMMHNLLTGRIRLI